MVLLLLLQNVVVRVVLLLDIVGGLLAPEASPQLSPRRH
jgi:hypothetical protein